jgi:transcriptional regulator with XRE-family HTH domain
MRGRKASDETATIVRELRSRGLSLRKIAQRAKVSKISVYRLTKGISWEQNTVQPRYLELDGARDWRTERAVPLIPLPPPQVPRARTKTATEDESEIDQAEAYLMNNRNLAPLYEILDLQNRMASLRSDDPLGEYEKRRKKSLSGIAVLNGLWNKCQCRR